MTPTENRNRRLIGLFFLGTVLFNFPILSLFSRHTTVLGFPLLYVYLFMGWLAIIILMALTTRSKKIEPHYPYSD